MTIEHYWDGNEWLKLHKNVDTIEYQRIDELHRNDGPAYIYFCRNSTIKTYFIYGKPHRDDGPAEIWCNDYDIIVKKVYWFNGIKIKLENLPFDFPIDDEKKKLYMRLKYGDVKKR